MTLLTNKLHVSLAPEKIDVRYDIFEVTNDGVERLSWSSRVFEAFGVPYILSVVGQGGDRPFYILAPKDVVSEQVLRFRFEDAYGGVIAGEDLESPEAARSLLPRKVSSRNVPRHVAVQLLLNALYIEGGEEGPSLQNVTGRLYCFKTGKDWVKRTRDGRNLHVVGLEFKVTPELLLAVKVRTFTRANVAGLKFDAKRKCEYPRYVVDFNGPTMRRVFPGERPTADEVFIQKQYEGKKSRIPFLKYSSRKAFEDSKCGVIQEVVERFNGRYAGLAGISFEAVDDSKRVSAPQKLIKAEFEEWFSRNEYVVVDVAQDGASAKACGFVADWLGYDEYLGKRPRIVRKAVADANNLLVIHEKEYYENSGKEDPYAASAPDDAACQHLTVETVQLEFGKPKRDSNLRFIIPKCLVEAAVKRDVCDGAMSLFDWASLECEGTMVFALCGPETEDERRRRGKKRPPKRYSFLEIDPCGALAFHQGCLEEAACGSRWDELAGMLASEWSSRVEGFAIGPDGGIDVIEMTDGFPVPDLAAIKRAVESIDWSLPKGEVMGVISDLTGDSAVDGALEELCKRVLELPGSSVKSAKLNALVAEVAKLCSDYSSRHIRDLLDGRIGEEFSRRLQTSVSRDKEALTTVYEPIVKMHCVREDDALLYWVNSFDSLGQTGRDRGCVIRRVRNVDGDEPCFANLLETLAVPIARLGNASVLPLPFKYLREWMDMVKTE